MANKLIPPGRTGHVAVSYEQYMLVWGGYRENPGEREKTFYNGLDLWIYSSVSDNWYLKQCQTTDAPPGTSGSAAVIIENYMYLFGGYGYDGEGCTNKLYKLDLETFAWEHLSPEGISPSSVDKMVGWAYGGRPEDTDYHAWAKILLGSPLSFISLMKILPVEPICTDPDLGNQNYGSIIGAYSAVICREFGQRGWTNQFFAYDPKNNQWIRPICLGNLPSARAAHAASVMNDKVYIFGGRHGNFRLNDLHCLDMKTMTWSGEIEIQNGPKPEGRSWHSLTALNDQFLILYGGFSQTNVALSDCWMFDTKSNTWQLVELPYEKPRLWHSACLNLFNEVLVYGGCTTNILDVERGAIQANDVIVIRIVPKSLYRICMDFVSSLHMLRPMWSSLPQHVQMALHMKVGNCASSNLDGS